MNSFRCEMILMSSRCNSFYTQSLGFIWFQDTRHFWLVIIFNATGFLYFVPFDLFQGMARAAGTFRFYSAFPMVSSNSSSSGSMKLIPRSVRAFSIFVFSIAQFSILSFRSFAIYFSRFSSHRWSGLDVACRWDNLSLDHMYLSGGVSLSEVNWVKLVHEYDNSLEPSMFQ